VTSKEFRGQPIKDLRGFLTEKQVHRLIEAAANFRDKVFLRLLWVTGARVSEILGDHSWYKNRVYEPAKVGDIDFEEGVIILNLLKRKQYPPPKHRVPLDKITLQNLQQYIDEQKLPADAPIFNFTRQRAFQIIREAGQEAGILTVGKTGLHNHHLRHSHCVAYIRHNNTLEGLRKLQQRIGHASISTTAQYLQFGLEEQRETEDVFGKW
jgi:integrase